jgi:hypothetical protein
MKLSHTSTTIDDVPLDIEFYFHAWADEPVEINDVTISGTSYAIGSLLSLETMTKIAGKIILNSNKRD